MAKISVTAAPEQIPGKKHRSPGSHLIHDHPIQFGHQVDAIVDLCFRTLVNPGISEDVRSDGGIPEFRHIRFNERRPSQTLADSSRISMLPRGIEGPRFRRLAEVPTYLAHEIEGDPEGPLQPQTEGRREKFASFSIFLSHPGF